MKVTVALEIVILGVHGFLLADREAISYPLGATAVIDVLAAPPETELLATMTEVADESNMTLARVRYGSDDAGAFRTLAFTPSAAGPSDLGAPQRLFGFSVRTAVTALDSSDDVVGRWVGFGSRESARILANDLAALGFETRVVADDRGDRLTTWLRSDPTWLLIDLAGLLAVFVAALVSAAGSTRVRAVRQVHGSSVAATAFSEVGRSAAFVGVATVGAAATWITVATLGWGARDVITGPGTIVVVALALAGVATTAACALAVVLTVWSVPGIVPQLAGKRPSALIQATSTLAFVAVLAGAFVTTTQVASSAARLEASIRAQEVWANEPDARSIALANTSESVVQELLGGWSRLVAEFLGRDGVLLSYPERRCWLADDGRPCLFVDQGYLERAGSPIGDEFAAALDLPDEPPTIHVLLPPAASDDLAEVSAQLAAWAELQRDLTCRELGCDPALTPPAAVEATVTADVQGAFPVYSSRFFVDDAAVVDPILIVVPSEVASGDFTLAAASAGNLIFFAPGDELSAAVDAFGVRTLVFSIDRPTDLAAGAVVEAGVDLTRTGTVLVSALALAVALMVVLASAHVERRRRPLFLFFLHGQSFARRYVGFFASLAALVSVALAVSVAVGGGSTAAELASRVALGLALGAATIPVLLVNERRFRADLLKRG